MNGRLGRAHMLRMRRRESKFPDIEGAGKVGRILLLGGSTCIAIGMLWSPIYLWFGRYDLVAFFLTLTGVGLWQLVGRVRGDHRHLRSMAHVLLLLVVAISMIDVPLDGIPRSAHVLFLPLGAAMMFVFGREGRYLSTVLPGICLALFVLCGSRLVGPQAIAFAPPMSVRMAGSIVNHALAGFLLAGVLVIYRDDMHDKVRQARDLARAVAHGELRVLYQPQVDQRGRLLGAEALVRWQHPDRGLLSPAHFIALAEDSLLIRDIGLEVLRQACALLRTWQNDPRLAGCTISVNVSPIQLYNSDFTDSVRTILRASGAPTSKLEFELTESALSVDVEAARRIMRDLHQDGIRWALDDFGTGFSSLALLRSLPVQKIKIDRQFVLDAQDSESGRRLLAKIIEISDVLGMEALAEGIEQLNQWNLLIHLGCRQFQGFLFGHPQHAESLTAMFDSAHTDADAGR